MKVYKANDDQDNLRINATLHSLQNICHGITEWKQKSSWNLLEQSRHTPTILQLGSSRTQSGTLQLPTRVLLMRTCITHNLPSFFDIMMAFILTRKTEDIENVLRVRKTSLFY